LHHLRIGGTEQAQITNQERPDRLSVPNKHIIERQTQAIGLALLVEDVDHQHAWLPPGGRKAVAARGRLRPRCVRRVRTRPPSRLTRTRGPASGPAEGTGRRRAASSAASRRRVLASAVAVVIRTRLDTSQVKPRRLSMWAASRELAAWTMCRAIS